VGQGQQALRGLELPDDGAGDHFQIPTISKPATTYIYHLQNLFAMI
jgi:hypothetical protein